MFSLSKKLDTNLRDILNNNDIEYYRVLIKYKTLQDSISKKISSLYVLSLIQNQSID